MRKYTEFYDGIGSAYSEIIRNVKINNAEFYIEKSKIVLYNGNTTDIYWVMGMKNTSKHNFKAIHCTHTENMVEAYKDYYAAIREYVEINFIK